MRHQIILFCCLFFIGFVSAQNNMPIKGTWVTNVASTALHSKANIKSTVALCKKQGLNTIFVVVWNNGLTIYPSKVVKKLTGVAQDSTFAHFDPLKEMITEGHKQGIKVHAWFEFGFSYGYKDTTAPLFAINTHWQGKKQSGQPLEKNGFYWWNAINPEVQKFMQDLVLEVVKNYKVDGVQGDDRLPAMPAEGGYDDYTKTLYKKETGKEVPAQFNEPNFINWKANKLSQFGKKLYHAVKKTNATCLVSWAPSIYPWSKEQYLQDWPTWLNQGYADFIMPQCYRYNIAAYEKLLQDLQKQVTKKQQQIVYPGILTGLGDGYRVDELFLQQMINLNRKYGFSGECLFYFESLKNIKKLY
jgi:uncharacterized lipoprotein YddW (UPF0748 family)